MPESLELGAQTLQGCLTLSWEWGPQPQLWVEGHFGVGGGVRAETGE